MKTTLFLKTALLLAMGCTMAQSTQAQCLNRVTHIVGSQIINGVSVTVSTTSHTDTLSTYCAATIGPYLIGESKVSGQGTGSYTFKFSPSIDSLSLSFAGINRSATFEEVVKLSVNGLHYVVPTIGKPNVCDMMAELTVDGDITGPITGNNAGWINTVIKGPISELTVMDSLVKGGPGGAIFSLNICAVSTTFIKESTAPKLIAYPNPSRDRLTIEATPNGKIEIMNLQGQLLLQQTLVAATTEIDMSQLVKGLYILKLKTEEEATFIKIIKE